MKKVLVTGATGFIGSNLTRELLRRGVEVHIISRHKRTPWRLKDVYDNIKLHKANLLDDDLSILIRKINPEIVFHLAAYGSLPVDSDFKEMVRTNVYGTANLISSLRVTDLKLFVNTSTSAEYGIKDKPMKETDYANPVNDYAVSKLSQTVYVQKAAIKDNFPSVSLRLFSAYGPFEDPLRLIPTVVEGMVNGNKEIELSSPGFVRDFVYVDDVIEAFLSCINLKAKKGQIYNIGSGKQYKIGEVVKIAKKETGFSGKILWNKIPKQSRQIEPKVWQADISKAKIELGWKPKTNLNDGILKTIEWYKNYKRIN